MNKCKQCNKDTTNPKFCSRSCSVSYNNFRRDRNPNRCKDCGSKIRRSGTYCGKCYDNHRRKYNVINDIQYNSSAQYAAIRARAVLDYKASGRSFVCNNCGYDKHAHICHIIPITDFPQDTLIDTVNSLDNLIALCPNCHWEFDNGLLWLFIE